MRVFRLEDENGRGPYVNHYASDEALPEVWREMLVAHNTTVYGGINTHPNVFLDCYVSRDIAHRVNFICGFASMAQLKAWFGKYLDGMRACGFRVATYMVSGADVAKGSYQLLFDRTKAVRDDT